MSSARKKDLGTAFVFLHGAIGDAEPREDWADAIRERADLDEERGLSLLKPSFVTVPWVDVLDAGGLGDTREPPDTYRRANATQRERSKERYFLGMSELEARLQMFKADGPTGWLANVPRPVADRTAKHYAKIRRKQANNYVRDQDLRNACLNAVRRRLPHGKRIVLLAHSLGSLLAADLIYVLPKGMRVDLLVTVGSPLDFSSFKKHLRRLKDDFPYERIDGWLNLVGVNDPVCAGQGIARSLPEVTDAFVETGGVADGSHRESRYLSTPAFGAVLEWLVGRAQERQDSAAKSTEIDVRIPDEVIEHLCASQFRLRVEEKFKPGETRDRWRQARRLVDEKARQALQQQGVDRSIAAAVGRNNSTSLRGRVGAQAATTLLLVLYGTRGAINPFEIECEKECKQALVSLARDLGFTKSRADKVMTALEEAEASMPRQTAWRRLLLIGGGVLGITLAPVLVIAAAPVGLAGGAAIVSGLAALGGPAGMMGGLVAVSTLAGASGIAVREGLVAGSPREVTQRVVFLQALIIANDLLDEVDRSYAAWFALVQMESDLSTELKVLEETCDPGAQAVKDQKSKLASVSAALKNLRERERDLSPNLLPAG